MITNKQKKIYTNPTGNIILNDEKLKAFPLRSGTRLVYSLSWFLSNILLEILANANVYVWLSYISLKRKINCLLSQMTWSTYRKFKRTDKKYLLLINTYNKLAEYRVNMQNQSIISNMGFLGGSMVKNPLANRRRGFDCWVRKIPWRSKWQSTSVFLPGKSKGERSLTS